MTFVRNWWTTVAEDGLCGNGLCFVVIDHCRSKSHSQLMIVKKENGEKKNGLNMVADLLTFAT